MAGKKSVVRSEGKRFLRCKLEGEQLEKAGTALAEKLRELEGVQNAKAESNKGYGKQIQELTNQVREATKLVNEGEEQEVDVEVIKDFKKGTVKVVRQDTRETVSESPIGEEDHQGEIGETTVDEAPDTDNENA